MKCKTLNHPMDLNEKKRKKGKREGFSVGQFEEKSKA